MSDPKLTANTRRVSGVYVSRVHGRIDSSNAHQFESAIGPLLEGKADVLIDCSDLEYMSSAGLRVLIASAKKLASSGRTLSLCSAQPQVREALEITRLSDLLDLHESDEEYFGRQAHHFLGTEPAESETDRNKRAVLRFLMLIQFKRFSDLQEVGSDEMKTVHTPSLSSGKAAEFNTLREYTSYLEDLDKSKDIEIRIRSMIAEGDLVAVHNITTQTYHDGRCMSTPWMSFYRCRDGIIVEAAHVYDRLHEQTQLQASGS
jgi:anti-sigma B factor antagonist